MNFCLGAAIFVRDDAPIYRRKVEIDWRLMLLCFGGLFLAKRRWTLFLACMIIYASVPFVFTNLHYVHWYYSYANNVFLIAAFATCLVAMMERGGSLEKAAYAGFVSIIACSTFHYFHDYFPEQSANHVRIVDVTNVVREITQADDVILIVGCDWSSEIPYYSDRRAFMMSDRVSEGLEGLTKRLDVLRDYRVGALVVHDAWRWKLDDSTVRRIMKEADYDATLTAQVDSYKVYSLARRN